MSDQSHLPYGPPKSRIPITRIPNKMSAQGQAMALLKRYQDPLSTGVAAVVLGFVAKKALKMENISTNSFKQALGSFALVSLAGIAAEEVGLMSRKSP